MDPEWSESDDLFGRIDAVLGGSLRHVHSSSDSPAHRVYGNTNSMPYRGAASSILCTSPYAGSSAGGNDMACAGTLNSLNHRSSPAGVSRMSIRLSSDSIVNEWATSRGKKTIVPGVPLIVRSPTETTISPSST